ncbi:hypothetical protein B7494_g3482 [Chlorociboria aeruginascens]|nr:hypothetical protein B7494_g3482 [Chlorociboria aeruginascens]
MLLRTESNGIPWKLVFFCIAVLLLLHHILIQFEPPIEDEPDELFPNTYDPYPAPPPRRPSKAAGTLEDFKSLLGLPSNPNSKGSLNPNPISNSTIKVPIPKKPHKDEEEYVAICMAVKDQARDLSEFFTHHYHHLGIHRFYIMDDGSEPPLSTFEYSGFPTEALTFTYFNRSTQHVNNMQDTVYNECARRFRYKHTWMAFIDADEYLEMTGPETLIEMLRRIALDPEVGALGVSWETHSSAGQLTRPPSTRKAFTDCISDSAPGSHNKMYKSIVRLAYHERHNRVHQVHTNGSTHTVDENGEMLVSAARYPSSKEKISLHHYAIKSLQEYKEKIARSNAMDDPKGWWFWDSVEGMAGVVCDGLAGYDP